MMLIVFFNIRGLVHYEFVPEGQTVNKEYYLAVLKRLSEKIPQKRPDLWKKIPQAEINNRTDVDTALDTNFRLSAYSLNDNDVLHWHNTGFQRCANIGNQYISNAGC